MRRSRPKGKGFGKTCIQRTSLTARAQSECKTNFSKNSQAKTCDVIPMFVSSNFFCRQVSLGKKKSLRHRQSHTLMHLHFFGQKCLSKKTGKKTKWRDEMRVRRHGSSFFLKPKTTNDYNTSSDNRTKRQTRWRIDNEPVSLIQRGSWRLKTSRNGRQALWRHGKEGSRK